MFKDIMTGLRARSEAIVARLDREDGVTAIEYGLIAALIAVVIIVALVFVGNELRDIFNYIAGQLSGATGS
jgi:pilus assembly protein Flp/PilA